MHPTSFAGECDDVFDTPYYTDEHKKKVALSLVATIMHVGGDPRRNRIWLIREVRNLFRNSMGLKEAKDLIDGIVNPPCADCGTRRGEIRA